MKKLHRISLILISLFLVGNIASATLRNVKRFEFFQNSGGLNNKLSPIVIADNEASDLQNVEFTLGGAIKKRGGYASNNNGVVAGAVTGIYQYIQKDGTRYIIQTGGDQIYQETNLNGNPEPITGAAVIASDSTALFDFTTANNNLLATNGQNPVLRWTGGGNATTIASAPEGKWIAFHKNIVFIANTSTNPSRVQFSNVLDETTWTATDWFDVGANDGTEITGLQVLLDTLYIFKENSIYRLSGTNRDNFVLSRMVNGTGCIAGHTVQVIENRIYFMARDGVYVYDGGINVQKISDKIDDTIDGLQFTRNEYAVSCNYKKKHQYWIAVTDTTGNTHNTVLVWDYFHNSWTLFNGFEVNYLATYLDGSEDESVFSGDYSLGMKWTHDSGNSDFLASGIDAYYETKWYRFPEIVSSEKILRLVRVFAEEEGDWDLTIDARSDFNDSGTSNTLNLTGTAALYGTGRYGTGVYGGDQILIGRFPVTLREAFFQLRFENSEDGEPFSILGYELYIEGTDRI